MSSLINSLTFDNESPVREKEASQTIKSDLKSFVGYLTDVFEIGRINDAGHYGTFKAKGHKKMIKLWFDYYMMNPKYCYDQAKEYFTNADEIMSKEYPRSQIIEF
jgi:hypothetical protein